MPKSVALFERIAYLALVLGVLSSAINLNSSSAVLSIVLGMQMITIAFQILFIWLVARKRKNWARWVWIVLMFAGTIYAIALEFFHPLILNGAAGIIAICLAYLTSVVSACFLLTPEAWAWFRLPLNESPDPSDMRLQP